MAASPQLPVKLLAFHRDALPFFELPRFSQKVVDLFFDRDLGAEQVLAEAAGNPAAAGRLSVEWEKRTGKKDPDPHAVDFWIPRLGMDRCRQIWLRGQLESRWGGEVTLAYAEAAQEWFRRWNEQETGGDPGLLAYSDSAYLAGLLFDLLWLAACSRPGASSGLRVLFEARFKRFLSALSEVLPADSRADGEAPAFIPKRVLAASVACGSIAELWFFLEDSAYAARYLKWEVQGIPVEIRRMLQRRYLGFGPRVAAAWVADRFPQLAPFREVIRCAETPSVFAKARPELQQLARALAGAAEVG